MIDYKDQLDRAGYAVRDKVGQVLSSGSRIVAYRDRAAQYATAADSKVVSLASSVIAKANGLLSNYKSIEAEALNSTGRANGLRAKMETDPTWKAIRTNPTALLASAGWNTVTVVNKYISDAMNVISDLSSLATRSDAHLKAVADLSSNVDDLDNFAQGKGLSAKLAAVSSFGGTVAGLAGNYLSFAKYAAVAVGLFFVWDIAKPLLAAKRAK